jgi:hypothetical protein
MAARDSPQNTLEGKERKKYKTTIQLSTLQTPQQIKLRPPPKPPSHQQLHTKDAAKKKLPTEGAAQCVIKKV